MQIKDLIDPSELEATGYKLPLEMSNNTMEELLKLDPEKLFLVFLLQGMFPEAWTIWEEYGPYKYGLSLEDGIVIVNGPTGRFSLENSALFRNSDPLHDHACLRFMEEIGLFDGTNRYVMNLLLQRATVTKLDFSQDPASAQHGFLIEDIPHLANGVVHQAELIVALQEHANRPLGDIYDDILCWVSPRDFAEFGGVLCPFKSAQEVNLHWSSDVEVGEDFEDDMKVTVHRKQTGTYPLTKLGLGLVEEWGYTRNPDGSIDCKSGRPFKVASVEMRVVVDGRDVEAQDIRALRGFASCAVMSGFGSSPDKILCRAPRKLLSCLPVADLDGEKVKALGLKLRRSMVPMLRRAGQDDIAKYAQASLSAGDSSASFTKMTEIMIEDSQAVPLLKAVLPAPVVDYVFGEQTLRGGLLSLFLKDFRFKREGMKFNLSTRDFPELEASNYIFPAKANIWLSVEASAVEDKKTKAKAYIEKLLAMTEYPTRVNDVALGEKPHLLLSKLAREEGKTHVNFDTEIMKCYMQYMGVEHFAEVAKSPAQWAGMMIGFTREQLQPYWEKIPRAVKVKSAARGLSI